jgi:uncharacterized protein (TIGR02266 family)
LAVDVDFKSTHNFYSAKTRDISKGGLFIETPVRIPMGSVIEIDLRFLKTRALVSAEVVWELVNADGETEGLGVRFIGLPDSVADRIETFMGLRPVLQVDDGEENVAEVVEGAADKEHDDSSAEQRN